MGSCSPSLRYCKVHLLAHQQCVKWLDMVQNAADLVCAHAALGEECFTSSLSSGETLGEGVLSPTPSLTRPFSFLWFGLGFLVGWFFCWWWFCCCF